MMYYFTVYFILYHIYLYCARCIYVCSQVYATATNGKDPRPSIVAAIVLIIISFVVGIPLTIWYFVTHNK